jgi:hypothetical protein
MGKNSGERKGFIHIVEVIVISIVMFIVLYQFSLMQAPKSDWSRVKLTAQAYDILFSLDKTGVNWMDTADVSDKLADFDLQKNIIYSLRVESADGGIDEIIPNIVNNPVAASIFKYSEAHGPMEIILNIGYRY